LQLLYAPRGLKSDRVVRKARHDSTRGLQVVLPHAIVSEGVTATMESEPVQFDDESLFCAAELVIDPVISRSDLNFWLCYDIFVQFGLHCGLEYPT